MVSARHLAVQRGIMGPCDVSGPGSIVVFQFACNLVVTVARAWPLTHALARPSTKVTDGHFTPIGSRLQLVAVMTPSSTQCIASDAPVYFVSCLCYLQTASPSSTVPLTMLHKIIFSWPLEMYL